MAMKKVLNFLESPRQTSGLEYVFPIPTNVRLSLNQYPWTGGVSQLADRLAAYARVVAFDRYESSNGVGAHSELVVAAARKDDA